MKLTDLYESFILEPAQHGLRSLKVTFATLPHHQTHGFSPDLKVANILDLLHFWHTFHLGWVKKFRKHCHLILKISSSNLVMMKFECLFCFDLFIFIRLIKTIFFWKIWYFLIFFKKIQIVGNHGVKVSMTNFIAFLCDKFPQNGEFSPYNVKFLLKSQNPHNFKLNPHFPHLKNSIPTTSPNIPTLGKIPHIWTHWWYRN